MSLISFLAFVWKVKTKKKKTMKRSIKIVKSAFSLLGYNIFDPYTSSPQIGYLIRRFILLGCELSLIVIFLWNISMTTFKEVGDKVFLVNVTCVYTIIPVQTVIFLMWRKKIAHIFKEIKKIDGK